MSMGFGCLYFPEKVLWTLLSCQNNKNHSKNKINKITFCFFTVFSTLCVLLYFPT